jgi:hypothetical protein
LTICLIGTVQTRPVMLAVSKSRQGWDLHLNSVGIGGRDAVREGMVGWRLVEG